jgi:glycine/D-amino acid oxidase-like deaminating enzyme
MQKDFLIIGQGIAGSNLALHLIRAGKSVHVIDNNRQDSSSRVAAGLFNPITGRKMVKTWKAELTFPYLTTFYRQIQKQFRANFFHEIGIYRPFFNAEEQNDWWGKADDEHYRPFIRKINSSSCEVNGISDPNGGISLNTSGYVDTQEFLDKTREYLEKTRSYESNWLSINGLHKGEEGWDCGNTSYRHVVLCDGFGDFSRHFFSFLPFNINQGSIFKAQVEYPLKFILNRGGWMIPTSGSEAKIGATYNHGLDEASKADEAKQYLEQKISIIYSGKIQFQEQRVGIRPATKDRRPFIGEHPTLRNLYIFNGFGSKAVSLTPFYAKQMVEFFLGVSSLDKEVNITRYI